LAKVVLQRFPCVVQRFEALQAKLQRAHAMQVEVLAVDVDAEMHAQRNEVGLSLRTWLPHSTVAVEQSLVDMFWVCLPQLTRIEGVLQRCADNVTCNGRWVGGAEEHLQRSGREQSRHAFLLNESRFSFLPGQV
jgi:hypothetical protein